MDKYKKKIKIIFCILLIFVCIGGFIGIKDYKTIGTFTLIKKKLPIYCVNRDDKKISITFDVSWGDDKTDEILDVLDKYNIKASFFVVGKWIDENSDTVSEIFKRGHEIGNHSNKHLDMAHASKAAIINDIETADSKIMRITGKMPMLFRFPGGSYNDDAIDIVNQTGHYCIQWDVDSIDWKNQGADIEYNRVINKVKSGSILLFHNYGKNTIYNLPRIIEKLESQGYEFIKVSELIYKDNYYIDSEGVQRHNKIIK